MLDLERSRVRVDSGDVGHTEWVGSEMEDFYSATVEEQTRRLSLLAVQALKSWGISDSSPKLLKYRENAVYRVSLPGGRAAALRLHRHGYHSDAELASELSWMAALGTSGVAVPSVIPALDGSNYVMATIPEIPESRQVDMLEWLDGEAFGSLETGLNKSIKDVGKAFRWVGELVARMHNHAQNWPLPKGFTRHAWDIAGLVGENPFWGRFWDLRSLTPLQRTLLLRARACARDDLAAYGRTPDNYSLIHADLLTDNMILGDGHVKALDFDDSGFGWHLFDIATIRCKSLQAPQDADVATLKSPTPASRIGTGVQVPGAPDAATPARGSRRLREGGSGDRGGCKGLGCMRLALADRSDAAYGIEFEFAARVDIPLDPPIPWRGPARGRGRAGGYCSGGPPLERKGSLRVGRKGAEPECLA